MKLNPYPVLLASGVLMSATVLFAQTGAGVELVEAGARAIDRDISSFAGRTLSSSENRLVAAADTGPVAGELDSQSRVAAAEKVAAMDTHRIASR
jgi:hypothetical protein